MVRYLLIGLLIFAVIITIIGRIRYRGAYQERIQEEKQKNKDLVNRYSGRAEGRITEHHWDTHLVSSGVGTGRTMKEDTIDATDSIFMVSYEFEVDGKTYTGQGEGSPAIQVRKAQTICYDPSDPNDNCTIFYLNAMKYRYGLVDKKGNKI